MYLRQSTTQTIRFGPFVDDTDGVTAETALTIAQADMQISKDGGAFAQKNAAGNATHDTDGWYSTSLNATDTATVGEFKLQIKVAGAAHVWVTYFVVDANFFDGVTGVADFATAANLTTVDTVVDGIQTDLSNATDGLGAIKTSVDAIPTTAMRGTDSANTIAPDNAGISGIQTDLSNATDGLGAIKTSVDAIPTTAMRGTDGANTVVPLTALQVNAEVDTAIADAALATQAGVTQAGIDIAAIQTDLDNATDGLGAIKTSVDAIPTTAMRGTDGANTVAPDNASITAILADTNELQTDDVPGLITSVLNAVGLITSGTAQAGTATTIQLAAVTSLVNDLINGAAVLITGGTGAGQSRIIDDWVSATDTATVKTWTTNPDATSTYVVIGIPQASEALLPQVNTKQINDAVVTGDGNATPWDGA